MPPTNRGVKFVRDENDEDTAELCDLESHVECWDITRNPNFYAREAQSFATRSLSTTMPPTNRGVRISDLEEEEEEELRDIERMYEKLSKAYRHNMAGQGEGRDDLPAMDANSVQFADILPLEASLTEVRSEGLPSSKTEETQNPQKQKQEEFATDQSTRQSQDLDENAKSLKEVPVSVALISNPVRNNDASKTKGNRVFALYKRLQSEEQLFRETSESMTPRASDKTSRFPVARPFMSMNPDDDTYHHAISRFPKERPSSLVNTGTRKEWTTSGSYEDTRFLGGELKGKGLSTVRNDGKDTSMVPTHSKATDWPTQQFLDKPRPFQSNVDMVTSNTSGMRFKRSSDLRHEEKNANRDYFDRWTDMPGIDSLRGWRRSNGALDGVVETDRSRKMAPDPKLELDSVRRSSDDERDHYSGDERVMHWLLTHLPTIQEEDAVHYFNCLLEDGYDSIDLGEILEEDLHFMKKGHRRALLRSLIKELHSEIYES
jgi:hypothetical protein